MENFVKRFRLRWWLFWNSRRLNRIGPYFAFIAILDKIDEVYGDSETV
jgi:hypothetical protein